MVRTWISRVLPWAAFVVALGFAFVQLAARHEAERRVDAAPADSGPRGMHPVALPAPGRAAPTAPEAKPAPEPEPPRVVAPLPSLEPLADWTVGERQAGRVAALKARVDTLHRARQVAVGVHAQREAALLAERERLERELAGARDPLVAVIQDAASGDERRVASARRYASNLSPLAVRRLRLKLSASPRLAVGLHAMLSAFPEGRETQALRDTLNVGRDPAPGSRER